MASFRENEAARVERVARSLCAAQWAGRHVTVWETLDEKRREVYRRMARAAIEAIRER